jgi:hypothetical protein
MKSSALDSVHCVMRQTISLRMAKGYLECRNSTGGRWALSNNLRFA